MPSERMPQTDHSWLSPLLKWLTLAVLRFPRVTLLLALAAAAASLWLTTTRLGFHTSRSELLDPQSDFNRRWLEYTKEFGDKEDVVVVVEGPQREQTLRAVDDVCRGLAQQSQFFQDILHDLDAPRLRQKGLFYLQAEDLQRIDGFLNQAGPILDGDWSQLNLGSMGRWIGNALNGSSAPQRQQILNTVQTELPRVMRGLQAALGQSNTYESPWPNLSFANPMSAELNSTRLLSDDGRMGFILLRLKEEDQKSFAQNNASIAALRALAAEVMTRHPDAKIGLTGLPIIEYDEMRSSEQSMTAATILSFLGVLAVLVVAYGGVRHSLMTMLALVIGMIWACGCVALTIGHVTILSIAFGSILFGLGINYGIYYISRYLQLRARIASPREALVTTAATLGPSITIGAVTSALAFFAAGFTDFPGVAQLGIVAGGGILLCWLAQMTVLPAMIRLCDKEGADWCMPTPLNLKFWLHPLFAKPRFTLLLTAVGTAALAAGMHYVHYDCNLLNMQPVGLESVELEHKLAGMTNNSAWFALSIADTPHEVAARKAAFLKLPSVARVEEVATKFPADAAQKQPLIRRIHERLARLPQQTPQIAVTPLPELVQMLAGVQQMMAGLPNAAPLAAKLAHLRGALQQLPPAEYQQRIGAYQQAMASDLLNRLQMLQAVSLPEPPQVADLPAGVQVRSVGKNGRFLMRVYSKTNIWDTAANETFVAQVRSVDPAATGNPLQVYEASRQMKHSFEQAAWYSLLTILPIVLLSFRCLSHTLLAFLPMALGLLQTFGLMGLLDIPRNPANIIVLPLVLGIGIEDGIHIVHEFRARKGRYRGASNAVIVSVMLTSLTTMVGFGALMIANHQGLQSLGRVLTIAMGFCLLNSLVLPSLLRVGRFGHAAPLGEESELDEAFDGELDGEYADEYAGNAELDDAWYDEEPDDADARPAPHRSYAA